jgi:cytochrome P450
VWSDAIAGSFTWAPETMLAARAALVELTDYMEKLIARRTAQDGVLIAALADAHHAGSLSRDDLLAQCVMLLFAGHETTTNLIGNGLLALLTIPPSWNTCAPNLASASPRSRSSFDSTARPKRHFEVSLATHLTSPDAITVT